MTAENSDFETGLEIPDSDGAVVRSGNQDRVGGITESGMVLQAHDPVGVALDQMSVM